MQTGNDSRWRGIPLKVELIYSDDKTFHVRLIKAEKKERHLNLDVTAARVFCHLRRFHQTTINIGVLAFELALTEERVMRALRCLDSRGLVITEKVIYCAKV